MHRILEMLLHLQHADLRGPCTLSLGIGHRNRLAWPRSSPCSYPARADTVRARHGALACEHIQILSSRTVHTRRYGDTLEQALFMDIVPATLRTKALAVLAKTARDTEYIRTPTAGGGYVCSDCEGGPGAHITAGLFGIKWFLMALVNE